jgi:class 3 adenylate cyclase
VITESPVAPAGVLTGVVAFTDICGFTEFTAVQGDEDALRLLAAQEEVVRARLPDGARIVKELGDGLLLWFPEPRAALRSALAFQDGFREREATTELPLWVRIGMHWGSQLPRGDDLIGHDVNIAARVVDVAGPSEVVVTEALIAKIGEASPELEIDELGPVVMKGLPDPVRLFRVDAR